MEIIFKLIKIILKIATLIKERVPKKEKLRLAKIIIDGQSILNSIYSLSFTGNESFPHLEYEKFEAFRTKINNLLMEVELLKIGYIRNVLPMEIDIKYEHVAKLKIICFSINKLLEETRLTLERENINIAPEQILIDIILNSKNPSNYFDAFNTYEENGSIKDHRYKKQMEIFTLHDSKLADRLISDENLENLWRYCPNIKVIRLQGADVTKNELSKLNLNKLGKLKALALSENNIDELPDYFTFMATLEFLDLSNNNLTSLPVELSHLKSLKYLNIKNNKINEREIQRILKNLKNAKIIY